MAKNKIGGYVVVYYDEGFDEVIFFDSLEEAQQYSKELDEQGIPSKVFEEVE